MMGAPYLPGFGRCGIPRLSIACFSIINGSRGPSLFRPCAVKGRGPWYPTSAKTGQIWGTHHSLPVERGRSVRNSEWLSRLIKPDAVDQIHETRVAAQGIEVRMDL